MTIHPIRLVGIFLFALVIPAMFFAISKLDWHPVPSPVPFIVISRDDMDSKSTSLDSSNLNTSQGLLVKGRGHKAGHNVSQAVMRRTSATNGNITYLEDPPTRSSKELIILAWPHKRSVRCQSDLNKIGKCSLPEGKTCLLACDPALYNKSEAIIFNLFYTRDFPLHKFPDQKWVITDVEAPPQSMSRWPKPPTLNKIKHHFNISSFFTSDATVPLYPPPKCFIDEEQLIKDGLANVPLFTNRSHDVAWFVSHCRTQSQREDYVRELRKFIGVDVYGKCGDMSCGDKKNRSPPCVRDILNDNYRFYLSFENSLCQDYITEKLWNVLGPLKPNVIPVVMGGVNYTSFLPSKTYIDVRDFKSPEDLAVYLHKVAKNTTLFREYIMRKRAVTCRRSKVRYLCQLCKHMHAHRGQREIIADITTLWSIHGRCTPPQKYKPGTFWSSPS